MKRRRKSSFPIPLLATIVLLGMAAVGFVLFATRGPGPNGPADLASLGGPFKLVDQTGTPRTDADFRGKAMLIFFGYSNCPDVCALTLSNMTAAVDSLGSRTLEVVPIFITIDPGRDTVARLANYAANFGPRLVALTGDEEAIASVAREYRFYYAKTDVKSGTDYMMNHSSAIYLMGPDGRYLDHFAHDVSAAQMSSEIQKHL